MRKLTRLSVLVVELPGFWRRSACPLHRVVLAVVVEPVVVVLIVVGEHVEVGGERDGPDQKWKIDDQIETKAGRINSELIILEKVNYWSSFL